MSKTPIIKLALMLTVVFAIVVLVVQRLSEPTEVDSIYQTNLPDYIDGMTPLEVATSQKTELLNNDLKAIGLGLDNVELFIRVLKKQKTLETWVRKKGSEGRYYYLKSYTDCAMSGVLGPKRIEGDKQVPEGFYYIDRFNPQSKFYLSLGINYPNTSDKILSNANTPGSDIFIHGGRASIGCVAITNEYIKEVYLLAQAARDNGQKRIPVHIYPSRMDDKDWKKLQLFYESEEDLLAFWSNLRKGYQHFEQEKELFIYKVDGSGLYKYSF